MKLKLVISLTGILMLYGFTMKPSTDTTTGKEQKLGTRSLRTS